ncbi:MAG: LysR family transcriptional regulator [Ideonella sp.]
MQKVDVSSLAREFDLNLLRFLRALCDTASVSRSGEAVGISQPAASRAVARLRSRFTDPLLVRTSRGYVLTPLAQQLAPMVRRALSAVDAVFEGAAFEPERSKRRFAMATTDYGMSTVLLGAMPAIRTAAPLVGLQIDPWSNDTIAGLERGEYDCALYADDVIPPDFHYRTLFQDGYALVCRSGHPLTQRRGLSALKLLNAAAAFEQFAPRYPFGRGHATDNVYDSLGLQSPRLCLEAPYFYAGAQAVVHGNLVAVLPTKAARIWAQGADFEIMPLREPRLSFEYRVIWHERVHRDPGVIWLRDLIVRSVGEPVSAARAR